MKILNSNITDCSVATSLLLSNYVSLSIYQIGFHLNLCSGIRFEYEPNVVDP